MSTAIPDAVSVDRPFITSLHLKPRDQMNQDLLKLKEEGVMVHSNLGSKDLEPGAIDPTTIDDPSTQEDVRFGHMYFIGGYTYPQVTGLGSINDRRPPQAHAQFRVLAYIVFDDDTPMARRREVAQATSDLCRLFFS